MSDNNKTAETEIKAYKVEITVSRKDDTEGGEETPLKILYAVRDKDDVVQVSDSCVWERIKHIRLLAADGNEVMAIGDIITNEGMCCSHWENAAGRLKAAGEWVEFKYVNAHDMINCTARVTAMASLPLMSAELTMENNKIGSFLAQDIILNGEPLFKEGDNYKNAVLRPHLSEEVNKVWECYIRTITGINCKVVRDLCDYYGDYDHLPLRITCQTMADMNTVLKALGVNHPEALEVNRKFGDAEGVKAVEAYVSFFDRMPD